MKFLHFLKSSMLSAQSHRLPNVFVVILLLNSFLSSSSFAQPFKRSIEGIPVTIGGVAVSQPFAGGVNSPNYQFVDIDGDNDLDLFIYDNDQFVDFYRNVRSAVLAKFMLEPHQIELPKFQTWFLFCDLNGDGKIDFLSDDLGSGVRYSLNEGTSQHPIFVTLDSTMLDTAGFPVFAGFSSIPALVDIDADGDFDFFSNNFANGTVNFYHNIGSVTSPRFAFVTDFYEGISIIGDSCLSLTTRAIQRNHGAGAFRFADIDGDGTQDFFWGDLFSLGIFFLKNVGTPTLPDLECITSRYPPESPVVTGGFNMSSFHDIDGDTDLDLFVGLLGGIVQRNGFWFLENTGDSLNSNFVLRTKNYLSMIDVGMNAHPALVDIDADLDLDLIIGNLNGELWFFQNIGSSNSPSFVLADTQFAGIRGDYAYAPAFVDIDNDGDKDLFVGQFNGTIRFYRNNGNPTTSVFAFDSSAVDVINVNRYAVPAFIDIDHDGDLDLFVGKTNGSINYYRNDGEATNFQPLLITPTFEGINVVENAKPTFVDYDGDGDYDLFVGSAMESTNFYENVGTPQFPQFTQRIDHIVGIDPVKEPAYAFGDIDNDGDLDMFVGNSKGGIHFYRNDSVTTSIKENFEQPRSTRLYQNYPNPFNPVTRIQYAVSSTQYVSLKVFNIFGQEVSTLVNQRQTPGEYEVVWNSDRVSSGVYTYRIIVGNYVETRKMIFLK